MVEIHHHSPLGLDYKPAGLFCFATSSLILKVQSCYIPSFRAKPSISNPVRVNGAMQELDTL